ncbi:late competence development ComFB family protein [Crocosphaera chwakensis]|uniref:Late competence development protein ComFB n=1 Tax=Crocosphaera chwakensis CCY0110 TaxID=391612 RepID=A3IVH9_9CHRO|nr:late competence development ComFB family protein [Crocosphaera chwakensis]EAZ89551.1 hypothetical protein CY0110_09281 [Crocosphaera chwakensis CCY0110]
MKTTLDNRAEIHVNIMELLVQEEIENQLKIYPQKLQNYINKVEVATYALNRLPPLYASSAIGKEYQKRTGQRKYKSQIVSAVRRALAAIERDPIKKSVPLISETYTQHELAKIALKKIENLLKFKKIIPNHKELSWNELYTLLYPLINKEKTKKREIIPSGFESLAYVSKQLNEDFSKNPNLFEC